MGQRGRSDASNQYIEALRGAVEHELDMHVRPRSLLTQREIARQVGVSAACLSRFLQGKDPSAPVFIRLLLWVSERAALRDKD